MRATWQIINEIIGKKSNNIDEIIMKNFKHENISTLLKNFSINFNDNVNKLIHNCNIKTINYVKTRIPNAIYLSSEEEIYNILKTLNIKKELELMASDQKI
mgnify:CR=1 FL=1